jgi:hypothetical protein
MMKRTLNPMVMMMARMSADQGLRRAAAGLVLAASPLLYALPATAAQYQLAWNATFADATGLQFLQAGMALSCFFIPLAPPVCVPLALA